MKFSLIPREEKFFDLIEKQADNILHAAKAFRELVSNYSLNSPAHDRLRDLEHEGDIITHEISDKLNRTFITPLDREDIHNLATELDDVLDLIQGVSSRMQLYRMNSMDDDIRAMSEVLEQSVEMIGKALKSLRDLTNPRRILDYCIEINRLENGGDRILERALSSLFANNANALDVIKWKEVYELAEEAIDKCEDVAVTIESIVVKYG